MLQAVHRVITRHLLGLAGLKPDEADSGAVTLIQRFGSAANLNIHLHCLELDSVYRRGADGVPEFVEAPAPTDEALQTMLHKIITRAMKLLTRRRCWSKRRVRPTWPTTTANQMRPACSGLRTPTSAIESVAATHLPGSSNTGSEPNLNAKLDLFTDLPSV